MKKNRKIEKTKKAILNAFTEEMKNNKFENIKITTICNNAEIRRATFYNYFDDKYDLLAYSVRVIVSQFGKDYVSIDYNYDMIFLKFVEDSIDYLAENSDLLTALGNSNLMPLLYSIMFEEVKKALDVCDNNDKISQTTEKKYKRDLIINYHFVGILGALNWWMKEKTITKEQLKKEVLTIIKDGFKNMLD